MRVCRCLQELFPTKTLNLIYFNQFHCDSQISVNARIEIETISKFMVAVWNKKIIQRNKRF